MIEGTDYLRGEILLAREYEMITKLEDFLRRRSKIALVHRHDEIRDAKGIMEACTLLFGGEAQAKYDEYFHPSDRTGAEPASRNSACSTQEASNEVMIRGA